MNKRLLYSAVLAIGTAVVLAVSPAFAGGVQVLSDAELQEVTASNAGDFGWKDSNSNLNGVQLNGNFQEEARALNINNSNRSANNFQTNILTSGEDINGFIMQTNMVIDSQHIVGLSSGGGDFGFVWGDGNSNVNGIQLNDDAQGNAHALNIANTHRSADNFQLNLLKSGDEIFDSFVMQMNMVIDSQWDVGGANNLQTNIIAACPIDGFVYQKNKVYNSQLYVGNDLGGGDGFAGGYHGDSNIAGVQLNGGAQGSARALNLINANRSANNAQTNLIRVFHGYDLSGCVTQKNIVENSQVNVGNNYGGSLLLTNPSASNRGGVQLNGWSQYGAEAINIINTNRSANNFQTNVIVTGSLEHYGWFPIQSNLVEDSQINVGNSTDFDIAASIETLTKGYDHRSGNSNQGGVQLNGYAQKYAHAVNISNTNRSANNAQTNIIAAGADDSVSGSIHQSNKVLNSQQNVGNNTEIIETTASSEEVLSFFGGKNSGNSNVGGVQGNGSAQKYATGVNIINSNRSASNFQLNGLFSVGAVSGCISQSNIVTGSQINVGNN